MRQHRSFSPGFADVVARMFFVDTGGFLRQAERVLLGAEGSDSSSSVTLGKRQRGVSTFERSQCRSARTQSIARISAGYVRELTIRDLRQVGG